VPFRFLAPTDLVVLVRVDATGVDTTKTLDTDYSVAGEGAAAGGTVTFLIEDQEPQTGETLIIYGNPPMTQAVDYISGGTFPAETHEEALDKVTLQGIRTRELAERALSLTDSSTDGSGEFDANGNRIKSLGTPTATTDATTKTYVDALVNNTALGPAPTGLIATGSVTSRTLADRWGEVKNVMDFGAAGDGVTNDTVAIQAAVDAGSDIYLPAGNYLCDGVVTLDSGTHIYGAGMGVTTITRNGTNSNSQGVLYAESDSPSTFVQDISVSDMTLEGQVATLSFSEFTHLMSLNGVKDVVVERVKFRGFRGDGIMLGSGIGGGYARHNENVLVASCTFDGVTGDNRNGISIIDGTDIRIVDNKFTSCTRSNMPGAIDIEPDGGTAYPRVQDITISNNQFSDIGGNVGVISAHLTDASGWTVQPSGFVISGNTIRSCTGAGIYFNYVVTGGVTESTVDQEVRITGNIITDAQRAFDIVSGKNVWIIGNSLDTATQPSNFGYSVAASGSVIDLQIVDNSFIRQGSVGGSGCAFYVGTRWDIRGNLFKDCGVGTPANSNAVDFGTGTSSYVRIKDNIVTSPDSKTLVAFQKEAGHTFTASTNQFTSNTDTVGGNFFQSIISDVAQTSYTPIVAGATTAGAGTYTEQWGRYNGIGDFVYFMFKIAASAGHTGTGIIQVSLPTQAYSSPGNAETLCSVLADGVVSTGGIVGYVNPAALIGAVGSVRVLQQATGTASGVTIPAGAFTVWASGFYLSTA
jgi:hypothetical protein